MATWQHSHNLGQTTRDRLVAVVRELEVQRARSASQTAPDGEHGDLQRIDKAVSLLQQAIETLAV